MNECVTTGIEVLDVRLNNELNPSKTCIPSAGPENQTSHIGIEYGSIFEVFSNNNRHGLRILSEMMTGIISSGKTALLDMNIHIGNHNKKTAETQTDIESIKKQMKDHDVVILFNPRFNGKYIETLMNLRNQAKQDKCAVIVIWTGIKNLTDDGYEASAIIRYDGKKTIDIVKSRFGNTGDVMFNKTNIFKLTYMFIKDMFFIL